MHRNLDRRVEALIRITASEEIKALIDYVDFQMSDKIISWHLNSDGSYTRVSKGADGKLLIDCQEELIRRHSRARS